LNPFVHQRKDKLFCGGIGHILFPKAVVPDAQSG
jgi:hypothetical protein